MANKNFIILALVGVLLFVGMGLNAPGSVGGTTPPAGSTGGVCTIPLSSAQTAQPATYNIDKPGTAVAVTSEMYLNEAGALNPGNKTTTPGTSYIYLSQASGYFKAKKAFTTACNEVSPIVTALMKDQDASISFSKINSDGLTANTLAANQSLTAGGTATIDVRLTPSALYLHLSGETNHYSVYFNTSYAQNFSVAGFDVIGIDGARCTPTAYGTPNAITGSFVGGWDCTGDFSGTSTTYRSMPITFKGASNLAADDIVGTIGVVGHDYYTHTIDGRILSGPVKNDGSAIQTIQSTAVYFKGA